MQKFKKIISKDLSTALSGLSQEEIAKIKSVLDRDQGQGGKYNQRFTNEFHPECL